MLIIMISLLVSEYYIVALNRTRSSPVVTQIPAPLAISDNLAATIDGSFTSSETSLERIGDELLGTGATRPNSEQTDWIEKNVLKTKKVKLNKLGFDRVNAERVKHGKQVLNERDIEIAPQGQEVEGAVGAGPIADVTGQTAEILVTAEVFGVDNSTLKYFPPIRSQGSLNSCAQFAGVYYTFTHMNAMARDLDAKNGGDMFRFSPKWTYNMVNGGANVGSTYFEAFAIAQKHGLATWAQFPYDGNYRAWSLDSEVWKSAINMQVDKVGKVLDVDTETGLTQVKQLLVNGYVLNYATYINSWVWKTIGNDLQNAADDSFVGKRIVTSVSGTAGAHAMTIVGYDDNIWVDLNLNGLVDSNEKGALRIANSWGSTWNESGFAWIAYQALRTRNPSYTGEGIFWYDEAVWITPLTNYTPQVLAEFTVKNLKRNELVMSLGLSTTDSMTPTTIWSTNRVLARAGGAYAYDGGTVERSGTFYLDFTDLVSGVSGPRRYFLNTYDSTALSPTTLQSFNLIDLAKNKILSYNIVPKTIDAAQDYAYIDYDFGSGNVAPTAIIIATSTSGTVPFSTALIGTDSKDVDGTIVAYFWDFGDGTTSSEPIALHTYSQAGNFTTTLTVTDNSGAKVSASVLITVTDPNIINPPASISVSALQNTATLLWTDNSNNETGFVIERALAAKGRNAVPSYLVVGTVGSNVTKYSESLTSGTYYYRVKAVNSQTGKESAYSNAVSIRIR